ncbi:MAG TPA: hypothetical protein VK680_06495 [Solirubrobacteraceae bacterium]|jgi:hypothetical protein|nr:hypothetical protein [Solirubrobacteraceae bacterium]
MRRTRVEPNETETGAYSREAGAAPEVVEPSRSQSRRRREPVEPERAAPVRRRRTMAWRTRNAGAAAVGTAGAGVVLLARLVMAAASVIALLIALAIVLRDVDANGANTIVKGIHEGANFFAGAFTGLIRFSGHPKRAITVDWGIALLVYLIVGAIVAKVIARIGRGGLLFERSHRTAPTT